MADADPPKGVVLKIFGIVLMFLGAINLMLLWRASMLADSLFVGFFLVGIVFYTVGAGRARYYSVSKKKE